MGKLHVILAAGLLAAGWTLPSARAAAPDADGEVLQAEPVRTAPASPAPTPEPTPAPIPARTEGAAEVLAPYDLNLPHLLLPYYLCAYTPAPDKSELSLGLFLSEAPGIDVSLGWGAMDRVLVSARVNAFGASNTVGVGIKVLLLPEDPASTKPAIALWTQGLFLNHRTLGEIRLNIFRGSRLQVGGLVTKDLGVLAQALEAGRPVREVMGAFRLHAGILAEYQTGREGEAEDAVSRAAVGARTALEATIVPEVAYAYAVLDLLPDWVDVENYYLGARYFTRPDLAFDLIGGRLQNTTGVQAGIAWTF